MAGVGVELGGMVEQGLQWEALEGKGEPVEAEDWNQDLHSEVEWKMEFVLEQSGMELDQEEDSSEVHERLMRKKWRKEKKKWKPFGASA